MTLSNRQKKFTLFLVLLVAFLDYMGLGFVYPLFSAMLFQNDSQWAQTINSQTAKGLYLGILLALPSILTFFSSPIIGALSDQKGRRPLYIFSLSLAVLSYVFSSVGVVIESLTLLFLGRIILGIADGNASVVGATLVDISSDSQSKAKFFGLQAMARGIGFIIGPFLGGYFAKISYSFPFYFAGAATFLNLILILFFLKETNLSKKMTEIRFSVGIKNFKQAFLKSDLRILFITALFYAMGWSFFYEFLPIKLINDFQFTNSQIGLTFAFGSIFYALSSGLFLRWIIRLFKPHTIIFYSLFLIGLSFIIITFLSSSYFLWIFIPIINALAALPVPVYGEIISDSCSKDSQGEVLGILQSVHTIAFGFSPLIAGLLIGIYYKAPFIISTFFMLLAAVMVGRFFKRKISLPN
jgi:DHA1 family tetracycline resistance protein-like MFS transporter